MKQNMNWIACILAIFMVSCQNAAVEQTESANVKQKTSTSVEAVSSSENRILVHPDLETDHTTDTLYVGAYANIAVIKKAEQEYFDATGHYTDDFSKLPLEFANVEDAFFLPDNGQSRIYLKNGFYYVLTKNLIAVYYDHPASKEEWYHLDFHFDGTNLCIAKTPQAEPVCQELGGLNPTPNERISSWIIYKLPADFLKWYLE